jgi:hypothetical protein
VKPRLLLWTGVLSSVVYVAADVLGAMRWPGYDPLSQTISELSAIGAPSRPLWGAFGFVYDLLLVTFGVLVCQGARGRRAVRVIGAALIAIASIGFFWPPMHLRGEPPTLTDTLHVVWASVVSLLILTAVAVGTRALGRAFRRFSFASLAALLAFGTLTFLQAPKLAAGEPTPWLGLVERANLATYLLWVAVLAVTLGREKVSRMRFVDGEELLGAGQVWADGQGVPRG